MLRGAFVQSCPRDPRVKDDLGLPWGSVVQPFAAPHTMGADDVPFLTEEQVVRCESCFGYPNAGCKLVRRHWRCNLCNTRQRLPENLIGVELRERPEWSSEVVEYEVAEREESEVDVVTAPPVYVAAVDVSGSAEAVEIAKQGVMAAVEALPQEAFFVLVTFSHTLSVYDLHSHIPHSFSIQLPPEGETELGLEEVIPLTSMLARIELNRDNIIAAIESLCPVSPPSANPYVDASNENSRPCGFGSAMRCLVDCFADADPLNVRTLVFLSNIPNYGEGALATRYTGLETDNTEQLAAPVTAFYRELGEYAVTVGVGFDLYVYSADYVDLASIKFLAVFTGGNVVRYASAHTASLPQDVYRSLSQPHAFRGLVRMRTSPGFQVHHSYGTLLADKSYENLHHSTIVDTHKAYAFDYEFTTGSGFATSPHATVQLAFAYSFLPAGESKMVRRLRVITKVMDVSSSLLDLYAEADPEVLLSLLSHKIMRATLDEGVDEARLLLRDWLTILVAQFNKASGRAVDGQFGRKLDASFSGEPRMQHVAQLVFGLLKNRVLSADLHPDERIFLQCLYSGLSPVFLRTSIYPILSYYTSPDDSGTGPLQLTRAAVVTSGAPIFLVDAYSEVVVYYTAKGASDHVFPPPQGSVVKQIIAYIGSDRHLMPHVSYAKAGTLGAHVFDSYLIEESNERGMSYPQFLESVCAEVLKYATSN